VWSARGRWVLPSVPAMVPTLAAVPQMTAVCMSHTPREAELEAESAPPPWSAGAQMHQSLHR